MRRDLMRGRLTRIFHQITANAVLCQEQNRNRHHHIEHSRPRSKRKYPELVTERQVMIESPDRDLNDGTRPGSLIQGFLDTDCDGARPSFANVAIGDPGTWADASRHPDPSTLQKMIWCIGR